MDFAYTLQFAFEYGPKSLRHFSKYAKRFVNITIGTMQLGFCIFFLVFIGTFWNMFCVLYFRLVGLCIDMSLSNLGNLSPHNPRFFQEKTFNKWLNLA